MKVADRLQILVLTLVVTTSTIGILSGCGGQAGSAPASQEASQESVSKYEQAISKGKEAARSKAAK